MNEATLEAQVNEHLWRLFPAITPLRITHQRILKFRIGHDEIFHVGYRDFEAQGRADVLVEVDSKPVAVLELKNPGKEITSDDIKQGLSYAKVLSPQAPLVIVSNGEQSRFFTSFDDQEWLPERLDQEALKALFEHAMQCGKARVEESIKDIPRLGRVFLRASSVISHFPL